VLPGPYSASVAALSLRMSKTSGASVCMRYAVSIELIAASNCGSWTGSRFSSMRFSDSSRSSSRRCSLNVNFSLLMYAISFFGSKSFPTSAAGACFSTLSAMNVPWCTAGRNALFHSGGPTVVGTSGQRTTKPGRLVLSVPNPYVSHEPSEGRPTCVWPVFIMSIDGS
jgi:hypothetical protein